MKKALLILFILLAKLTTAQWTNATIDSVTSNTKRDEVGRRSIAFDNSGNLHVVYYREALPFGWNIFHRMRMANGTWMPEDSVSSSIGYNPQMALNKNTGTVYVVFERDSVGSHEIVLTSLAIPGSWGPEQVIANDTLENFDPAIAVDGAGNLHLAWITTDSTQNYKISYATNLSGTWVTDVITGSALGQFGSGAGPEIAVDNSGVAHIVYRGGNFTTYKIHHAYNLAAGSNIWGFDFLTTPNAEDLSAAIAIDNDTVVHVLLSGNYGFGFPTRSHYMYKRYSDQQFNTAVPVAPNSSAAVGDIALDSLNMPHFILDEISGNINTGNIIYADTISDTLLINTTDTYYSSLAFDQMGNGCIAAYKGFTWQDQEVIVFGYNPMTNAIINPQKPEAIFTAYSTSERIEINFTANYKGTLTLVSMNGQKAKTLNGNFAKGEKAIMETSGISAGNYVLTSERGAVKISIVKQE